MGWRHEADRCEGERSNADDDASRQLQSEASIEDDASDAATIREKPESKSDRNADEETQGRFPLAGVTGGIQD